MNEMLNYIFNNMHDNDNAIKKIAKALNTQRKINKQVVMAVLSMSIYIAIDSMVVKTQQKLIDRLTKEVEELKQVKGVN